MKKLFIFIIILIVLLYIPNAFAQEAINDFSVKIEVNTDASIDVSETITYDFGTLEKHGIYRDIRYKYKLASGNYKLRLSDFKVDDGSGNPYIFELSDQGDFKQVKIGDPNKTITGVNIYRIKYTVSRAINFFDDHDELYWNTTGNDWQLPIKQVKAELTLPAVIKEADLKIKCFAGPAASVKECLSTRYIYASKDTVSGFTFISDLLQPGDGQTIVISLPKGVIAEPSMLSKAMETIKDNWIVVLPFVALALMFYLWNKRGRDPKGRGTIIAQFDAPDNLSPAEVGTINDEQAQNRDVSAQIINLAIKGYLKIARIEKPGIFKSADYDLTKTKDADDSLGTIDKQILAALFKDGKSSVMLSALKEKFYKDLESIKKEIYKTTVDKGYFTGNPRLIRNIYLGIGIAIIMLGAFVGYMLGWLGIVSIILSGIIVVIFSFLMPAKTIKGVQAKEYILGLKKYLSVAEKDRINFHNAPEKNPAQFEKLLPYAMVLGVEKEWAKQFEDIYKQQPNWYNDSSGAGFNAVFLASSLNSFSAKANSVLASAPSSAAGGGSGFSGGGSGGGFGGGGGGSW